MQTSKRSNTFPIKQQHCIGIISLNGSSRSLNIALTILFFKRAGYKVCILNFNCRGSLQPKSIQSIARGDELCKGPSLLALTVYQTGTRVHKASFQCKKYKGEGESKRQVSFERWFTCIFLITSFSFRCFISHGSFCFTQKSHPDLVLTVFFPFCFLPLSLSRSHLLTIPSVLFSFSMYLVMPETCSFKADLLFDPL